MQSLGIFNIFFLFKKRHIISLITSAFVRHNNKTIFYMLLYTNSSISMQFGDWFTQFGVRGEA